MSAPSPETQPLAQPTTAVSPPSYNSTPALPPRKPTGTDEKIAYTPPVAAEGLEVQRVIDDDNLPEVVPQPDNSNLPEKVASPTEPSKMADYNNHNNNNINNTMTPPPPFSPPSPYTQQPPNGGYIQQQAPNGEHIQPANTGYSAGQQQNMSTLPQSGSVTPLHLLGNQGDTVDCPFCERRSMTRIEKSPSWLTHLVAVALFFSTFCGALAPYMLKWSSHVTHVCENCGRKVASRRFGEKGMKALGTPEHLKQQSRFAVSEQPANVQQV